MSTPSQIDFDRDRLRPLLDSGSSMFQLVSYEWERVDGALITAALDTINQALVAIPIIVLFEFGILLSKIGSKLKKKNI